jgi:hypothetical protein
VRHQQHVAVAEQRAGAVEHPVHSHADVLERLSGRRAGDGAVDPHRPGAAHLLADLRRRPALVAAVVDLHEVLVDRGGGEAGELGGPAGPQAWAHPDRSEPAVPELPAKPAGLLLALGQQRQVGDAGVLAAQAPLGLPVPQHHDLAHGFS